GKISTMKMRRSVYACLLAFTLMLVAVSGCLLKQTIDYKWANRELILQNDSLKGVVIELTRKIDITKPAALPSPSIPRKK
ncbi:MAG TPA: hypothetical protein VM187_18255, partial [Niastella sp.]|nr:hypothetical protein [Niastella sp.]